MLEWLWVGSAVAFLGGLILLGVLAMRKSQQGDASKRGQDAAEPGGFYNSSHSGD